MLLELKVKNLGIIEDMDWKLDEGLNVITGETGAGKSLVIDAVEQLFTGSAGEDIIRHGAQEAHIEGVFALPRDSRYTALKNILNEKELNPDEDVLVISCNLRRQKPGIVRINGQTVTRTFLRQIGRLLIDIHGQSEHLSLLDTDYHLSFLDSFAHATGLRNNFAEKVSLLRNLESELARLQEKEKDQARQEEFLKYQIDEIKKARLREGEDEDLEKERHLISYSEKLKECSLKVCEALSAGDSSGFSTPALTRLYEAVRTMKKLVELDPSLNPQLEFLEKTVYGLEEVARDIRSYTEKLEFEPGRLEEIESRLELIRNLKRKYGRTITEILSHLEKSEQELESLSHSSERHLQIEKEISVLKKEMGKLAEELSQKRAQAARELIIKVTKELSDLEMSQMQFTVSLQREESSSGGIPAADGKNLVFNHHGADKIEFLVSTNPGEPHKSLARIASTGEISRFTLALKGALSEADNIPVLIFDEVDIGVGGRSGDILGKKLWALARNHQVICVTHLPQIAAFADAHYGVRKESSGGRTTSRLEKLDSASRIHEIATMLAGPGYSGTARKNAQELLQQAGQWKKTFSG